VACLPKLNDSDPVEGDTDTDTDTDTDADALAALAENAGYPEVAEQLGRLADLDTDDDGDEDAISAAFLFEAQPCTLSGE
jgi:hypothetical protein